MLTHDMKSESSYSFDDDGIQKFKYFIDLDGRFGSLFDQSKKQSLQIEKILELLEKVILTFL